MSTPAPTPSGTAPRRSRLVLGLAWLLATVLAATVAWWAVTAVGRERGAPSAGLLSQAEVEQQLARQDGTGAPSTPDPTPSGTTPEPAPTPSASPAPVDPTTPAAGPAPGSAGGTGAGATPAPAPGPAEVARTWDVVGGQVATVCTGATITLLYATPAGGWGVEVGHAGPAEVEVEFRSGDEESRLRAECVAGTPEATRDEAGGGDDDGVDDRGDDGADDGGDDRGGDDDGGDDD